MVLQDRAPIAKGHLLIIPKRHVARAHELFQDEWKELTDTLPRVVTIFQKAFNTDQYLILEKNGPYAGQTVFHVHFHVIPIPSYKDEDVIKFTLFSKIFDIKPYRLDDEELKEEVTSLRHYFQEPIEVVQ
jgi:diadenosine tetraphosphate (Ap4A) HIT family hydrolase